MYTVISTIISCMVTLAICMINNSYQRKSADTKQQETINMIDYKLSELAKKVEKHNSTIERTYELEKLAAIHEQQIHVCNHRIDDLEKINNKN